MPASVLGLIMRDSCIGFCLQGMHTSMSPLSMPDPTHNKGLPLKAVGYMGVVKRSEAELFQYSREGSELFCSRWFGLLERWLLRGCSWKAVPEITCVSQTTRPLATCLSSDFAWWFFEDSWRQPTSSVWPLNPLQCPCRSFTLKYWLESGQTAG